ncbi:hypothetical protein F5146DRAFT_1074824 [Armillaria mellea]|nr:hypothetical protein F5146DRAFT_1074824 [Armillaria mellea]
MRRGIGNSSVVHRSIRRCPWRNPKTTREPRRCAHTRMPAVPSLYLPPSTCLPSINRVPMPLLPLMFTHYSKAFEEYQKNQDSKYEALQKADLRKWDESLEKMGRKIAAQESRFAVLKGEIAVLKSENGPIMERIAKLERGYETMHGLLSEVRILHLTLRGLSCPHSQMDPEYTDYIRLRYILDCGHVSIDNVPVSADFPPQSAC